MRTASLALAGASMLFTVGIFEIGLRAAQPIAPVATPLVSFHQSDPVIGWRGRPGITLRFVQRPDFDVVVSHDAEGFRRSEPPRPDGATERVLMLGDSFTWGWGVGQGEVFTDVLQTRLAPRIAIYNRGVNGVGTAQEYLLLRSELARRSFRHVVLLFFENDLRDNVSPKQGRRPYFELVGGELEPRNQPPAPLLGPVRRFLTSHSRVFQLVDLQRMMLHAGREDPDGAVHDRNDHEVDPQKLPGAEVTARLLAEIRDLCAAEGARFTLVYVPHASELARLPSPNPEIRALRIWLDRVAAREGLTVVDLAPAFHAETDHGQQLIYSRDEHWTPAGHHLAAEVLLASLVLR